MLYCRYDVEVTHSNSEPLNISQIGDEKILIWLGAKWAVLNPQGSIRVFRPDTRYILRIDQGVSLIVPLPGSSIRFKEASGKLIMSFHEVASSERQSRWNPLLVESDIALMSVTITAIPRMRN